MSTIRPGRWRRRLAAILGSLLLSGQATTPLIDVRHWAVYYGAPVSKAALQPFDLVVLEPDQPWHLPAVRHDHQRLLAYLSLGEVHRSRPYYADLAAAPDTVLGQNRHWPDAMIVDPRSTAWRDILLQDVAPAILAKGYDGFFLDTLDTACDLEADGHHPGAVEAAAGLVLALKAQFPEALLVTNGGAALLPRVAPALAALGTESIATDYRHEPVTYQLRDEAGVKQRLAPLQTVAQANGLPILVVEYADPARADQARAAAAKARQLGLIPYVADIGLGLVRPPVDEGM